MGSRQFLEPLRPAPMTTTQRNALSGVGDGDVIFNSTLGALQVLIGGTWYSFGGSVEDLIGMTLSATANVEAIIRANSLDQLTPPAANTSWNGKRQTNLGDAAAATDALNRQSGDARYQQLDADLTALAQGAGWLLDANTWTVHVVPTQAGMTTVVAANTIGHAGLTYTNGDAVIVTGLATTTGPINGSMYYIVGQTGTTVQLANAPGGAAVVFGGTADSATVTLTGVNQFTVAVDATGYLGPSTKISYNDGGVDYGYVATAKNNSGTTTVTLIPNNDYSIANATLTAPRFSYFESPVGFPASFAFSPVFVGYSTAGPTLKVYTFKAVGRTLYVVLTNLNTATSNAVTHTMSLPIASVGVAGIIWSSFVMSTDSGTVQPGQVTVGGSAQFATVNGKITGGNTASGNSAINGIVTYEF